VIGYRESEAVRPSRSVYLPLIPSPPRVTHPFTRTASRGACAFLLQVYNPPLFAASHSNPPPLFHSHLHRPTPTISAPPRTNHHPIFPPPSSVKLSKQTKRTYLSCFFASISNLYGHLLERLQRFCRMRVGAFEDRSEPGSPTTSTAASGTVRDMPDQGPSFDVVVIGCGGGPFETNLSA